MSHVRTQIRAALKELVDQVEGLTGRVVIDPSDIRDADAGEWAEVVLGAESVDARSLGSRLTGRVLIRQLGASVVLHCRGRAEAIERIEELLAAIEVAVFTNRTLGGLLFAPLTLAAVQPFEPNTDGSLPRHTVQISWSCAYSTNESDPTVAHSKP